MRSITVAALTVFLLLGISAAASAKGNGLTAHGSVTSVDLGRATFTIHHKNQTLSFTLAQRGTVEDNGQIVGFGALKIGDVVEVRYKVLDSNPTAERVVIEATPRHP